jgi:hypothetical protein
MSGRVGEDRIAERRRINAGCGGAKRSIAAKRPLSSSPLKAVWFSKRKKKEKKRVCHLVVVSIWHLSNAATPAHHSPLSHQHPYF